MDKLLTFITMIFAFIVMLLFLIGCAGSKVDGNNFTFKAVTSDIYVMGHQEDTTGTMKLDTEITPDVNVETQAEGLPINPAPD